MSKKKAKQARKVRHLQWEQKQKKNNSVPLTVENMREMLRGVKWQSFCQYAVQRRATVTFRARVGLYMGRAGVAIIGHRQYVAWRPFGVNDAVYPFYTDGKILNAHNPKRTGINLQQLQMHISFQQEMIIKGEEQC